MIPAVHKARIHRLVRALDLREWRPAPKGTSHKTANVARQLGLITAQGEWSSRRYRLTVSGAMLKEWLARHAPEPTAPEVPAKLDNGGRSVSQPGLDTTAGRLWSPPPSKPE